MATLTRMHVSDLRGGTRLAFDAAVGIVALVEAMHRTVQQRPGPLGPGATGRTRGITGLVYRSVEQGVRLAGRGLDMSMAPASRHRPAGCCWSTACA